MTDDIKTPDDKRRWTLWVCPKCATAKAEPWTCNQCGIRVNDTPVCVMPVATAAPSHTCECCEQPTTRPYVHPVEGIDLCAPCVASMPRERIHTQPKENTMLDGYRLYRNQDWPRHLALAMVLPGNATTDWALRRRYPR